MDPQPPIPPETTETPNVSETVKEVPKKDSHPAAVISVGLFVIASLATVIFLYYQNQKLKNMLAAYQSQASPTPAATADPTANWEKYTNMAHAYSIKYPEKNFEILESSDDKFYLVITKEPDETSVFRYRAHIVVELINNPNNLPLNQLGNQRFATDAPEPYDLDWKETSFAGLSALTTTHFPPGDQGRQTIYLLKKDDAIFAVWNAIVDETFKSIADQILSTFKFLNEQISNPMQICEENSGKWLEEFNECEGSKWDQVTCEEAGGTFDLCASPCRHINDPNINCIQICVPLCKFN